MTLQPHGHARSARALAVAIAAGCLCGVAASAAATELKGPSRPGNLKLHSISKTAAHISWLPSRSDVRVEGYRVFVNGVLRASVRTTSYRVSRLGCGTSNLVAVAAYDALGRKSGPRIRRVRTLRCSAATTAPPTAARCSKTASAGAHLAGLLASAGPGSVVCLGSGTYGPLTLRSIAKSSDVTVRPAPGADVVIGELAFNVVAGLRLTGLGGSMKIAGGNIDLSDSRPRCSKHLTFDHITFTAQTNVLPRCADSAIKFDHDVFDGIDGEHPWEGRLTIQSMDQGPDSPVGVTISNSHFGGRGCSDGIQVLGDAYGVQIGPGNAFTNLPQDNCNAINGAHVDPIQFYGQRNALVVGNYFHDNDDGSGGIMSPDGDDDATVVDNVFVCTCIYPYSIYAGGAVGWTIRHNTFIGGTVRVEAEGGRSGGNVVRDNLWLGGRLAASGGAWGTSDHNLNSGESGVGNIRGTPVFVGGKKPTSYAGFRLMSHSKGKGAASDGMDMGIRGRG